MKTFRVRAVLFQEAGWWCAQCLEYDIATQAKTKEELKAELERAISIHIQLAVERAQEPFSYLPKAPERYFQMYRAFELAHGAEESSLVQSVETCVLASFAYPAMAELH